jgi:signal-transduction protein with cAMP-binding, CBS, and nucleotidyltransferase domain
MATKSIGEIMTKKLEKIIATVSAHEAAKKMRDKNVSSLIVTDTNDKPIGIITERNLVRRVVANDANSSAVKVQDVMFSPPVSIDANSPVESAADVMIQNKVRHLLVVDNNDISRPLGIITTTDFASYLKENLNMDDINAKILESLKEEGEL